MQTLDAHALPNLFQRRFGREPETFRAPGRVNLIGEHTDYNDGFVLPAALDLATYVAIAPRADDTIVVHSENLNDDLVFDLKADQRPSGEWGDYVRGVTVELQKAGFKLAGADISILSTLPLGSGLSASAALEVAFGFAMLTRSEQRFDPVKLATICQRAENEFVGMRCGVMDQFISCQGVEGSALLLDCRSLEARPIPIDPSVRIVVCNTMVHHQLASSAFNARRQECEQAVAIFSQTIGGVAALRDVSLAQFQTHESGLPAHVRKRARHVISENARVIETVRALEARDFAEVGRLMNASHASLRDDYEVSCPELDLMAELSRSAPGVYGARMTGGGFGGCTVSLVAADAATEFAASVGPAYQSATGLAPMIFTCTPAAGAGPAML